MSVANLNGVSDMSIIYNNTLMKEVSEGLFYVGCSLFNFMCAKIRIENKTLITLIIYLSITLGLVHIKYTGYTIIQMTFV